MHGQNWTRRWYRQQEQLLHVMESAETSGLQTQALTVTTYVETGDRWRAAAVHKVLCPLQTIAVEGLILIRVLPVGKPTTVTVHPLLRLLRSRRCAHETLSAACNRTNRRQPHLRCSLLPPLRQVLILPALTEEIKLCRQARPSVLQVEVT